MGNHGGLPLRAGLGDIVHRFKTLTTKRYIDGVKNNGWQRFNAKLWQHKNNITLIAVFVISWIPAKKHAGMTCCFLSDGVTNRPPKNLNENV
jgi:hypothetical protein